MGKKRQRAEVFAFVLAWERETGLGFGFCQSPCPEDGPGALDEVLAAG